MFSESEGEENPSNLGSTPSVPDSRVGVGHLSALAEHRMAPLEGKAVRGAPFCQLGMGKGILKVV